MTWDPLSHPETITSGGVLSKFVYAGDGSRLVRQSGTATTIYVGDSEITYNSAGSVTTGKRTYSSGSSDVAFRDTASGTARLWWTASDWQGSTSVQADTATLSATAGWVRASYSPYGTQRLSGPSSWTGDRGWLGLVRDGATGLVQTGARLYDPLLQQFISPDPLLNPLAPNPYLYAGANPILFSDPSGLWFGESLWNSVVNSAPVQFAAGWHAQTVQWGISAAHTVVQAVRPGGSVSQSGRQVGAAVSSAAGKFGRDAVSSGSTQKAVGNLLGVDAAVSHGQAAITSGQSGNWFNAGASAANATAITAGIAALAIPAAGQLSTALRIGHYAKVLTNIEQTATKTGAIGAENAANAVRLGKQLASQQQMGEVGQAIAGRGSSTAFRGAARAAEQYGGEASEYAKMTSSVYRGGKGIYDTFETHWIERIPTGERFEFKTKFPLAGD